MANEISGQEFRQIIGQFATGVTVVASGSQDEIHAMTANAVSSLSLDPLLVLVCIDKRARMLEYLEETPEFSINILREDQQALSNYFAGIWKKATPPPFRFVPWDGIPRLEGSLAALACRRHALQDGGDHWILIGKVVALHQGIEPRRPLLFYGGRYGRVDRSTREPAPDLGFVEEPVQVFYDPWRNE